MWVILRLLAALVAFIIRRWYVINPPDPAGQIEGEPYYVKRTEVKGRITEFKIGLPLEAPGFTLSPEGTVDRFFKKIHFSREYQTADAVFDKDVYIASDHSGICEHISKHDDLRQQVLMLFQRMGFNKIYCDGGILWLRNPDNHEPNTVEIAAARKLQQEFKAVESDPRLKVPDRFFWRALLIESVVWSIFVYAVGGFFENIYHHEDYHVHLTDLFEVGLLLGAGCFLVLIVIIFLDLHRSSRGHRVLVESALLLALGFPGAGVQAASDLNRYLDSSEPVRVERIVDNLERRTHRSRRSTWYSYHMVISHVDNDPYNLPGEIEITEDLFDRTTVGDTVAIDISAGWLGLPWYYKIDVEHPSE